MNITTGFERPTEWPTGLLHDFGIRCPQCGGHHDVMVTATVTVQLTEGGSVDSGDHEYTPGSPATCRSCGFRSAFADFQAIPAMDAVGTLTAVSCEWSTDTDNDPGAAYWAELTPQQMAAAYTVAQHFWPAVQILNEDQILTIKTPDAISYPLLECLAEELGSPHSIT